MKYLIHSILADHRRTSRQKYLHSKTHHSMDYDPDLKKKKSKKAQSCIPLNLNHCKKNSLYSAIYRGIVTISKDVWVM